MVRWDQLQLYGSTDVGRKRPHNEDNFLVDRDIGLCIVADGMGGHAAGEVASAMAVATIHEVISRNREVLRERTEHGTDSEVTVKQVLGLIEGAVQGASARIHADAQSDPAKRGMGTTLSLLLVLDTLAYVAHVGDSRIYLERAGVVRQLTEDHTMAAEMLRLGMVSADRLDRVPHRNAITRAVGIYPNVNVDTFTIEVLPGDQFLLATDGLTGYLATDQELLARLGGQDGEQAVHALIDLANARGGKDNITVVLLRIGRTETDDGSRARLLALKQEVLARVPLFCRLDERELGSILGIATVGGYAAGETVVREGEYGDELFVVLSGKLAVSKGGTELDQIGPGGHIGEMALIRTTPRSATVTAVEPCELVLLRRRDFFEVIRTEPSVAVKLLWQFVLVLADRLEQTSYDLTETRRALAEQEEAPPTTLPKPAPTPAAAETEADPFSAPPPASLGGFRLGYAVLGQDSPTPPPRVITDTVPDAGRSRPRQSSPGTGKPPPDRPSAPRGLGEAISPARPDHRAPTGPAAPSATPTLPAVPTAADDLRQTVPFQRHRNDAPSGAGGPPPGGAELDALKEEIDELRREFRDRLKKAREGGGGDKP